MLIYFHKLANNLKNSAAKRSKLVLIPAVIAVIVNILICFLIVFQIRPLIDLLPEGEAYIPLHYNIYTGIDSYGRWERLFYMPMFGWAVIAGNLFVAFVVYNRKEIISYFLAISAAAVQIILLIATIFIILINI